MQRRLEKQALGVFAQLVLAQVFKTCGGCEQRSLSVRFRYTPALLIRLDFQQFAAVLRGDGPSLRPVATVVKWGGRGPEKGNEKGDGF